MSGFSSNEIEVMNRTIEVQDNIPRISVDIDYYFEVDKCIKWIKENELHKVCLQFPDYLLHDSVEVVLLIEKKIGLQPYVLADTSYGSCCVDMVAAQHVNADGIIHFGHACLSPTSGLPILYIFDKCPFDADHFISLFRNKFEDRTRRILVFYGVEYQHCIDAVVKDISSDYCNLIVTTLATSSASNCNEKESKMLGRIFTLPENTTIEEYCIVFIGKDGRVLSNIVLTMKGESLYMYDPSGARQLEVYTATNSKFLMKRQYLIERVKDATTLGILVGTLGVKNYLEAVSRIKQLAKQKGKKCYIIAIGKPNVAKLANFPEIQVFVLVACSENSLLDSKEFLQPIVTPYEMELACCTSRKWSEKYVLEFNNLFSGTPDDQEIVEHSVDDAGDVSLVSGQVRTMAVREPSEDVETSDALAVKSDGTVSTALATGSKFFSERSWQGLQINLGKDEVVLATKGRSGIPTSYDTDREAIDGS